MKLCKECGQPIKVGRHKLHEYEHAQGCPKAPMQVRKEKVRTGIKERR